MRSGNLVMIVMLVKHDKPTDYKEAMVDPSPRNGYEPYIIRDRIHVCLPSGDLGKSSGWHAHRRRANGYYKIDVNGIATVL